ncbi:F0F1 ATP synthase subunit B [Pseudactinotalea sp. Z1739]|uniref:F0F1 ATP synthase subunit B n=1 Tax=Pseudactinotalea sp. Z1739 TaxID=3413028 RepID=UPI003C7B443C
MQYIQSPAVIQADEYEPNLFVPPGYDILWSLVVLVIIGFFFYKFLLPRINAVLDERAAKIEGGLALAEQAQTDAAAAKSERQEELARARREAAEIREDANAQAAQIVAEAREQAKAEATRLVETANRQIEAERRTAVVSLRSEIGGLATELSSRIIGESLADDARQSRVIDRFLDELEAGSGEQELADAGVSADTGPVDQEK